MIRSMTGYGRGRNVIDGREILVELRSVNNRYYDFTIKLPRAYGYIEDKVKNLLSGSVTRGKLDIYVTISSTASKNEVIGVNKIIAEGYISALRDANKTLMLNDDITLSKLMRFPDIFNVQKIEENEEIIWNMVRTVAEQALQDFLHMREAEGEKMLADITSRLVVIEGMAIGVQEKSSMLTENYRKKLYLKLKDLLSDNNIEDQRILIEAAVVAEKSAVDEETVRLLSHISQFRSMLYVNESVGRKLDFIVQEMNREVNTIGSKSQDIEVTRVVVDMKSEIEKIREQIQNIE